MGMQTDQRLVAEVLQGRSERFTDLVERYLPAVRAIAYSRCPDNHDVEDIVQETFLRAYEKLASLRKPERFASWLYAIARRCSARTLERVGREAPLPDEDAASIPADAPDVSGSELSELVRHHLENLPEQPREILLLYYYGGQSTPQIAQFLGVSEPAVRKRLQRAREQLGASLVETLADTREADRDIGKQAARIASVATASSLYTAATGGTATAAIGLPALAKGTVAAGAAALLTAGTLFIAVSVSSRESELASASSRETLSLAPIESATAVQQLGYLGSNTPDDESSEADPGTNPTPEHRVNATDEGVDGSRQPSSREFGETDGLNGVWRLQFAEGDAPHFEELSEEDGAIVDIAQDGAELTISGRHGYERVSGTGVMSPETLEADIVLSDHEKFGRTRLVIDGAYEQFDDRIVTTGTYFLREFVATLENNGEPRTYYPQTGPVAVRLIRLDVDTVSRDEFIDQKYKELAKLNHALHEYAKTHNHRYPPDIEVLAPTYVDDLAPYRPEAGVDLDYLAANKESFSIVHHRIIEDPFPYPEPWDREVSHEEFPIGERMYLYEEYLEEKWGDWFMNTEPILRARYDRYELDLVVIPSRGVKDASVLERDAEDDPAAWSEERRAVAQAQCMNNLKQLGLCYKMFCNESPMEYGPGGFIMMHPEYIPDLNTLTCPGEAIGTRSYELAVPGAGEPHPRIVYESVFGPAPEDTPLSAYVPAVYELRGCSGTDARGVIFMDGHAERLSPAEFAQRVEPFLGLTVN